jgi:hypothetical protein
MLHFTKSYPNVIFIAPRPYGKHSARCFCTKQCSNEKLVKLYIDTVWINTLYLAGSFDAVAHPEQIHLLKQPVRYTGAIQEAYFPILFHVCRMHINKLPA